MLGASTAAAQGPMQASPQAYAAAREAIAEGNLVWGRARVAYDRAAFDSMLAPEFYAQIRDRRMTRQEFVDMIAGGQRGARLVRFDASVLTVRPQGDSWVAIIQEKLEIETTGPDGNPARVYALWITRDGWKETAGRWQILFSEVVDSQQWRTRPPFTDW